MSREGIIVFQLIWNITEQLRVPVPVPDAAPSSVAKTKAPEVVSYWVDLSASRWKKCPTLRVTRIGNFIPPYISRCVWASFLIAIALHRRRPLSFLYRIHWWDFFSTGVLRTRANLLHANNGLLDWISGKWLAVRSSPSLEVVPSQDAWVFRRLTEMPIKQFLSSR